MVTIKPRAIAMIDSTIPAVAIELGASFLPITPKIKPMIPRMAPIQAQPPKNLALKYEQFSENAYYSRKIT